MTGQRRITPDALAAARTAVPATGLPPAAGVRRPGP